MGKSKEWEVRRADGTGTPERVENLSAWARKHPEWFPNWKSAKINLAIGKRHKGWIAEPIIDGVASPKKKNRKSNPKWELRRADGTGTPERVESLSAWIRKHPEWFPNWKSALTQFLADKKCRGWVAESLIEGIPCMHKPPCEWEVRRADGTGMPERVENLTGWVRSHPEWFPNWKSNRSSLMTGSTCRGWIAVRVAADGSTPKERNHSNSRKWEVCRADGTGMPERVENLTGWVRSHPEWFPNWNSAKSMLYKGLAYNGWRAVRIAEDGQGGEDKP